MRVTIICPEALIVDGNQLAMVLGYTHADAGTYASADWQDADGNLYAVASLEVAPAFIGAAQSPLQRPAWDTDNAVDMDAAARAQASIAIWGLGEDEAVPVVDPGGILAMFYGDPISALAMVGVSRVS